MGYLGRPDATKETIDDEDWLRTGDVGRVDEDGYVAITGRIKVSYLHQSHVCISRASEEPRYSEVCVLWPLLHPKRRWLLPNNVVLNSTKPPKLFNRR